VTAPRAAPVAPPDLKGTAGYETPYPYLDKLQEKMEERLAHRVPVNGRFCGFCFGRIREADTLCPYCERAIAESGVATEVPQDVLRAYLARQKTEARWVHMGAFFGLIVTALIFVYLVQWGPWFLDHPAVAFTFLLLGGYLLAQLFGPLIGGQLGYAKGSRKRDALWARWLESRRDSRPGRTPA
jgi:hypothetical protein